MANYYISDLHLRHANVIRLDGRPFPNMEEMDYTPRTLDELIEGVGWRA